MSQVGVINPGGTTTATSIEIAVWATVGGRGTLIGPIVGAFFVNGAKSWFTQAFPELWPYILGLSFIRVTIFLPQEIIGLVRRRKEGACPPLMAAGARIRAVHEGGPVANTTESGGRAASYGRVATGEFDLTHGAILYLDALMLI